MANQETRVCVACDCADDNYTWTVGRRGPFCHECWENITDPDSTLLLEDRLAQYEHEVERLKACLTKPEETLREEVRELDELKSLVRQLIEAVEAGNPWPHGLYEQIREAVSE